MRCITESVARLGHVAHRFSTTTSVNSVVMYGVLTRDAMSAILPRNHSVQVGESTHVGCDTVAAFGLGQVETVVSGFQQRSVVV